MRPMAARLGVDPQVGVLGQVTGAGRTRPVVADVGYGESVPSGWTWTAAAGGT